MSLNGQIPEVALISAIINILDPSKLMEADPEPLVDDFQQAGIVVTIVKVLNLEDRSMTPIYFEVRTVEEGEGRYAGSTRTTRTVEHDRPVFKESLHYNTQELVDDNLTFILRRRDGSEIGRHTERNMKHWFRDNVLERELFIKDGDRVVAEVVVSMAFKEHQDVISGICVPDLSLIPKYPYNPKYNALDGYNPNLKTNRANCFSFFDGDRIPGFDDIDIFPAKFVLPKNLK